MSDGGTCFATSGLDYRLTASEIELQIAFTIIVPAEDIFQVSDVLIDKFHIQIPVKLPPLPEMGAYKSACLVETLM